jgi:2-hydroxychromene-2-carboxylate isomerase
VGEDSSRAAAAEAVGLDDEALRALDGVPAVD